MGLFRAYKSFRGAVALAVLAVCTLNTASIVVAGFHGQPAGKGKAVQDQAIAVSTAQEICHHHLEGCPKDCFCPKISQPSEVEARHGGELREPTLVNCTEDGGFSASPRFSVFLPDPIWEMLQALEAIGLLKPVDPSGLPNPFRDPPQKVPIA